MVDIRSLVPLNTKTIPDALCGTGRLLTVEQNPRLCSWGAEIVSIVTEERFTFLDGPPIRITTPHIPQPGADVLEDAALPSRQRIVDTIRRSLDKQAAQRGRKPMAPASRDRRPWPRPRAAAAALGRGPAAATAHLSQSGEQCRCLERVVRSG